MLLFGRNYVDIFYYIVLKLTNNKNKINKRKILNKAKKIMNL